MPKAKVKSEGGCTVTELHELQKVVVKALMSDIQQGIDSGEINQAAIKNALQLCRDNNIVAIDDTMNEYDRLAAMLPEVTPVDTYSNRVFAAYE